MKAVVFIKCINNQPNKKIIEYGSQGTINHHLSVTGGEQDRRDRTVVYSVDNVSL